MYDVQFSAQLKPTTHSFHSSLFNADFSTNGWVNAVQGKETRENRRKMTMTIPMPMKMYRIRMKKWLTNVHEISANNFHKIKRRRGRRATILNYRRILEFKKWTIANIILRILKYSPLIQSRVTREEEEEEDENKRKEEACRRNCIGNWKKRYQPSLSLSLSLFSCFVFPKALIWI